MTLGILTTLADRKDTQSVFAFSDRVMTVKGPNCMAILLTKGPCVGFEFHRCLHVQGCFTIGGTITEAPSNGMLPFERMC